MGLFGGNFTKPGPGVSKEEAAKRNYFDILGRRVWDLVKLNLLFVLCNILFIAAAVFLILPYFLNLDEMIDRLIMQPYSMLPILPFIPFMGMGPFIAGLTYVLRNWTRQEHAFLWSDFFEQTKKNWKQGLALSVLSTALTYLFITAVLFYLKLGLSPVLVLGLALVLGLILLSMNFYTYPIAVTFDMKLKDILKNAGIFAMAKLPQNVFILLVIGAVHFLLLTYLPNLWAILMVLFLISWSGFTMNYYVWHVINKHMISNLTNELLEE